MADVNGLAITFVVIAVNGLAVTIHGVSVQRLWKARRVAQAEWREAHRFAEVAALQARVIEECRDLFCDDCKRIAHGYYMTHAYPAVTAALRDADA